MRWRGWLGWLVSLAVGAGFAVLVLAATGLLPKERLRPGAVATLKVDGPAVIVRSNGGFIVVPLDPVPERKTKDGRTVAVAGRRLLIDGKDHGLVESADEVEIGPTGAVTVNGASREPAK